MKRDDDYIRTLLFQYEAEASWLLRMPDDSDGEPEESRERYHVLLMMDVGLVTAVGKHTFRLTASGHDFIAAIRSDTNWKRAKDVAYSVGGVGLSMLRDIALDKLREQITTLMSPLA